MPLIEWRTVRGWVSATGAVIAALATVYLGVIQEHPKWHNDAGQLAAIAVVGAVAVVSAIARPVRIFAIEKYEQNRHSIEVALRGLAWAVHEHTGGVVPVQPLGASAWVIRGIFHKRLHRVARERVTDYPVPSDVKWTKGKGVIGTCWDTAREQVRNTHSLYAGLSATSESDWEAVDDDIRMGMSFRDFCQVKGKYGSVIAVPVRDSNNRLRGVVALDSPKGFHTHLKQEGTVARVHSAANLIGGWLA